MGNLSQLRGTPFMATNAGGATSTATKAGVAGVIYYITDFSVSSDLATAVFSIKDGATIIWRGSFITAAGTGTFAQTFNTPLTCTSGNAAVVTINGTAVTAANIAGYAI